MSKPPTENPSIVTTLQDQHRKTMKVVRAIKSDTEILVSKAKSSHERLVDENPPQDPTGLPSGSQTGHGGPEAFDGSSAPRSPSGMDPIPDQERILPNDRERLIQEVVKRCVGEVMNKINPVLTGLDKFVKANSIEIDSHPSEPDDDQFAEKLIEQMKLAIGRRERIAEKIAMARLKRSNS